MNFRGKNLKLLARNEGKLKSFESCTDLRAWSHSAAQRDLYLKDWMRSDMPVCVLPACSITSLFSGDSGSGTQRCHPACKSKGILDSICCSCDAMRDCLKQDGKYQRYFDEEEFETCHWPCERCLEALKTIKLFWKLVAERIFRVNFSACQGSTKQHNCQDSVQKISQQWQKDMVKSAHCVMRHRRSCDGDNNDNFKFLTRTGSKDSLNALKCCESKRRIRRSVTVNPENRIRCKACTEKRKKHCNRKSQCGFSRANAMKEVACGACIIEDDIVQARIYKAKLSKAQIDYNKQKAEIEQLKSENSKLKAELLTVFYPTEDRNATVRTPAHLQEIELDSVFPYEATTGEKLHLRHPLTDSEMIITMKNCKNDAYRHVSMLQVLHKTNDPVNELSLEGPCLKNEDPIAVLNKVHKTFGDIVTRELNIAKDKNKWHKKRFDVDATFQRKLEEKPPSFANISSHAPSTYFPAFGELDTGTPPS